MAELVAVVPPVSHTARLSGNPCMSRTPRDLVLQLLLVEATPLV